VTFNEARANPGPKRNSNNQNNANLNRPNKMNARSRKSTQKPSDKKKKSSDMNSQLSHKESSTTSNDSESINSVELDTYSLDEDVEYQHLKHESELPKFYWFQRAAIDAAINEIRKIVPNIDGRFLFVQLMQMVYEADINVNFKQCLLAFVDQVVYVATNNG